MSRNQYTQSSLELSVQVELPFSNKYIKQKTQSDSLALLFPGMRYTCDMPLLYYTTELFLDQGRDILQLWSAPDFKSISQAEQTQQLLAYSEALLIAGKNSGSYKEFVLVGKSLGTIAMTLLITKFPELLEETTIWFTPLLNLPPVSQALLSSTGPAFVAGSDADPTFDQEAIPQIKSLPNTTTLVINKADHSLEIPGDPLSSVQVLSRVMKNLASFSS